VGLLPTFLLVHSPSDFLLAALVQSGSVTLAGLVGLIYMPRRMPVRFVRVAWQEVRETYRGGFHIFLSTAAIKLYTSSNTFLLGFLAVNVKWDFSEWPRKSWMPEEVSSCPLDRAVPHISHLSAKRPKERCAHPPLCRVA